jgi:hypothetical protein
MAAKPLDDWGSESASDRVWPGQPPARSQPRQPVSRKTRSSGAAGPTTPSTLPEPRAPGPAPAAAQRSPTPDVEEDIGGKVDAMDVAAVRDGLVERGLLDPKAKKVPDEELRAMLRGALDDEAARAWCEKLAKGLPLRAAEQAQEMRRGRMLIPFAAAEAASVAQKQAELFVLRHAAAPPYTRWNNDQEPPPSSLDSMGRWAVPIRRKKAGAIRATTLKDLQERAQRVEAQAAQARSKGKAPPRGGSRRGLSDGGGGLAGGAEGGRRRGRRGEASRRPRTAPPARARAPSSWRPTHGPAGDGFALAIGAAGFPCSAGLGVVRPTTAAARIPSASVTDHRLRPGTRALRVSAGRRPATAGPRSSSGGGGSAAAPMVAGASLPHVSPRQLAAAGAPAMGGPPHPPPPDARTGDSDVHQAERAEGQRLGQPDRYAPGPGPGPVPVPGPYEALRQLVEAAESDAHFGRREEVEAARRALGALGEPATTAAIGGAVESVGVGAAAAGGGGGGDGSSEQRGGVHDEAPADNAKHAAAVIGRAERLQLEMAALMSEYQEHTEHTEGGLGGAPDAPSSVNHESKRTRLLQTLEAQERELGQLQIQSQELSQQVFAAGSASTKERQEFEAMKQKMSAELAHAARLLQKTQQHQARAERELEGQRHKLRQARGQLQVGKQHTSQVQARMTALENKLRQSEIRRQAAMRQLQNSTSSSNPRSSAQEALDAVKRRRIATP